MEAGASRFARAVVIGAVNTELTNDDMGKIDEASARIAIQCRLGTARLSKRDRSLVTYAARIAAGKAERMDFHIPNAIGNGVTQEEIVEQLHALIVDGHRGVLLMLVSTSEGLSKEVGTVSSSRVLRWMLLQGDVPRQSPVPGELTPPPREGGRCR